METQGQNFVGSQANAHQEGPRGLLDELLSSAQTYVHAQKDHGAAGLENLAGTVRHAADGVREEAPTMARYADHVASSAERVSQRVRERNAGELLQDAQEFARQQPALVIGTAILAGVVFTRLLKSTPRDTPTGGLEDRHDTF